MRKQAILVPAVVVLLAASASVSAYSGGDGSAENPYRIATPNDLNDIGNHPEDWNAHFVMVNDVNLADYTNTEFNIIGISYNNAFTGVFDGNGHAISNFAYDSDDTDRIGLFGFVGFCAEIRNLAMENVSVDARDGRAIGGLAGINDGIISNCYARGSVSGDSGIGGLVGVNIYGTISDCAVKGSVSGNVFTGGLVGWNDGIVLHSYADCIVSGGDGSIGGLVGFDGGGMISNCYSTGTVEGDRFIGGLIGASDCGTIFNCYATALLSGSSDLGGVIGESLDSSFTNCFWNSDINPSLPGIGNIADPDGVIGETTANMKKMSTFTDADWDFVEIWNIGENQTYPYLRVYPAGDLNHDGRVDFFDFAIAASHWLHGDRQHCSQQRGFRHYC